MEKDNRQEKAGCTIGCLPVIVLILVLVYAKDIRTFVIDSIIRELEAAPSAEVRND